jgi:AcrR family transcriptional regulator
MKSANSNASASQRTGMPRLLDAIEHIMISSGYSGVSMRSIATEAGVALGSVSHFGSKETLIDAYAERLFGWYLAQFDVIEHAYDGQPRKALFETVRFIVDDLETERTSHLFPEFWAMAAHIPRIQDALDSLYARERDWLERLLRAGWPTLGNDDIETVIGTLVPMIEGHCIFVPKHRSQLYSRNASTADAIIIWLKAVIDALEVK